MYGGFVIADNDFVLLHFSLFIGLGQIKLGGNAGTCSCLG